MKISERIRRANGEKPDYAIDNIGDIGHWQGMNDAALIAEAEELVQLTDDQHVVLEWLKRKRTVNKFEPLQAIAWMLGATEIYSDSELGRAYYNLTDKEEFQVLAAFAEWGLSTLDN